MMRRQMTTLTAATNICMDSWSLSGAVVADIAALAVNAPVAIDAPQSEADVVIALRGTSDVTRLSASK